MLLVSLPTMPVGSARYSRSAALSVLCRHARFVVAMTAGSVVGRLLLGVVPAAIEPLIVALLLVSAVKGVAARTAGDLPPRSPLAAELSCR